jgi:tRNA-modifying protein YgfZ
MIIGPMTLPIDALSGATVLDDWGLLRVSGADALSFLNGQLTQQMMGLRPGHARLAGYCSPKGRLLASFVVWCAAEDDVMLACSADLLASTAKRLSMFVLRAKCRVIDASHEHLIVGLAGASARGVLGDGAAIEPWQVRALDDGWSIALPPALNVARRLLVRRQPQAAPLAPALDIEAWRWLEASSAVPRIVAATVEQFVPQMVNFELVGGVDFRKGCFPGQEVVARSQYRGALKRRMFLFDSAQPALPGQEIVHSEDPSQPAGMVVNAGTLPGRPARVLAEVKLAALESGTLHVAMLNAPALHRVELPYSLDESVTS